MMPNRNNTRTRSRFWPVLCLLFFVGVGVVWVAPPAMPLGSPSTPRVTSTFDRPPPPTPRFTPFPRPTP
jgi:hypothetical protein